MSLRILSKSYKPWAYLISGVPKNFLIGNVGDAMLHTVEFGAAVRKDYTQSSQLIVSQTTNAAGTVLTSFINSDATRWNEQGFAVGDFIVLKYDVIISGVSTTLTATGTVDNILDDEMLVNITAGTAPANGIIPSKESDTISTDNVYIYSAKAPDQILIQYFNVENTNDQPDQIKGMPGQVVIGGDEFEFDISRYFSDEDGDSLSYDIATGSLPDGLQLIPSLGAVARRQRRRAAIQRHHGLPVQIGSQQLRRNVQSPAYQRAIHGPVPTGLPVQLLLQDRILG